MAALSEAQEALGGMEALRTRADAAEAARDRHVAEVTRLAGMVNNLEARLQQVGAWAAVWVKAACGEDWAMGLEEGGEGAVRL